MKKFLLFVFILMMAVTASSVFAGAPTEYEIPGVGTEINGFMVTDVTYWDQYATDVVTLSFPRPVTRNISRNILRQLLLAGPSVPIATGIPLFR